MLQSSSLLPASSRLSPPRSPVVRGQRYGRWEKSDVFETTRPPSTIQRKRVWGLPGLLKQAWDGLKANVQKLKQAVSGGRNSPPSA